MQRQMDQFSSWLEKWRIAVNADKSNSICYRSRRKPNYMVEHTDTTMEDEREVLRFDYKFKSLIITKGRLRRSPCFVGTSGPYLGHSMLPICVKTLVYLTVCRSADIYASSVWWPEVHTLGIPILDSFAKETAVKFFHITAHRRAMQERLKHVDRGQLPSWTKTLYRCRTRLRLFDWQANHEFLWCKIHTKKLCFRFFLC